MKKSTIYIVIGVICAVVLTLLFLFDPGDEKSELKKAEEKKKTERKPNDWEKYDGHRTLDPYGYFIFYNLLKEHSKNNIRLLKKNSQYRDLDTVNHNKRLYVFFGQEFRTHYKRLEKILDFVNRGNDAFIATELLPEKIKSAISDYYTHHRSYYKNVELNFTDEALKDTSNFNFRFIYKRKNTYRRWGDFQKANYYYETYEEDRDGPEVMETNMVTYNPVFIKVKYGKGYLYLHTVPYTFTNVVMKHERGFVHAEKVISCLPDEPIIWDRFLNDVSGSGRNGQYDDDGGGSGGPKRSSPLQFILENRSLRWAWYLLLAAFVLYLLFKGKRMQKIIPPKEKFENTSMDFADTMSKLYLQYGQHKYIVFQQERNLVNYIRSKYHIHAQKADEEYLNRVAVKSGVAKEWITEIFARFAQVRRANYASSTDVVEIYAKIEYFYKNCK